MAEAVGFVSGVEGRADLPLAAFQSALLGPTDGGDILASVQTDEIEGIAQAGVAFLGDVADPAEVAALFGH